jgi:hypothetical protein
VSSRYLSPRAERGRTTTVESAGTLPTFLSSLIVTCAPTVGWSTPFSLPAFSALPLSAIGVMAETTPTRKPPSRTSLPLTRFDPLESWTLTSVVGTNGSPLFAL